MDGRYDHLDAHSGNTRRCARPATDTQAYHEPSTIRRYGSVEVPLNAYPSAPSPSIQGSAYGHSRGSYHASPFQFSSHHTEAGNGYLAQHQTDPRSSTGSERTSWPADTQSFAAATSSGSTSSEHRNLRHSRMMDSSQEQSYSPSPFPIDQRESLQLRSNEASSRPSVMQDGHSNSFWDPQGLYVDPARLQLSEGIQSQDDAEPWSLFNSRYQAPERGYTYQEQESTPWGSGNLSSVPTTFWGGIHGASVSSEHQEMSKEAFNIEVESIMGGTSQGLDIEEQPPQQISYEVDQYGNGFPPNGVAFQCRVDRAATPLNAETDAAYDQRDNLLVYLSPGSKSPDRGPASPSSDSSHMSMTSFSEPAVLSCGAPGCDETFHGVHRRGSLNRHVRRKHRGAPGDHPCAEPYCDRTFNRSDSRLKHYRKHHPWLANGPAVRRGPQGMQLTGSPQRSAGRRGG